MCVESNVRATTCHSSSYSRSDNSRTKKEEGSLRLPRRRPIALSSFYFSHNNLQIFLLAKQVINYFYVFYEMHALRCSLVKGYGLLLSYNSVVF